MPKKSKRNKKTKVKYSKKNKKSKSKSKQTQNSKNVNQNVNVSVNASGGSGGGGSSMPQPFQMPVQIPQYQQQILPPQFNDKSGENVPVSNLISEVIRLSRLQNQNYVAPKIYEPNTHFVADEEIDEPNRFDYVDTSNFPDNLSVLTDDSDRKSLKSYAFVDSVNTDKYSSISRRTNDLTFSSMPPLIDDNGIVQNPILGSNPEPLSIPVLRQKPIAEPLELFTPKLKPQPASKQTFKSPKIYPSVNELNQNSIVHPKSDTSNMSLIDQVEQQVFIPPPIEHDFEPVSKGGDDWSHKVNAEKIKVEMTKDELKEAIHKLGAKKLSVKAKNELIKEHNGGKTLSQLNKNELADTYKMLKKNI